MTILFLHGWTSKPGGVKPTYLADHGHTVLNPVLPDEDFAEAVRIAQAEFDRHRPDVIVGSSRGGVMRRESEYGSTLELFSSFTGPKKLQKPRQRYRQMNRFGPQGAEPCELFHLTISC